MGCRFRRAQHSHSVGFHQFLPNPLSRAFVPSVSPQNSTPLPLVDPHRILPPGAVTLCCCRSVFVRCRSEQGSIFPRRRLQAFFRIPTLALSCCRLSPASSIRFARRLPSIFSDSHFSALLLSGLVPCRFSVSWAPYSGRVDFRRISPTSHSRAFVLAVFRRV